ncbi:MAG: multidrug effflux MFS transporter [Acidimicrobiia bacterium]
MNAARDLIQSKLSRLEFTLMLSMSMAVAALAVDIILPAMGELRTAFGLPADSNDVAAVVTFFFAGLAIGQGVWGIVSDALGRKRVLYISLAVYICSALASAVAPSLVTLLVVRFVWGFGAAGPQTMARSVVRDTYEGAAMARALSFIMAVFVLVPIVAPTLGTAVLLVGSWPWIFVSTAVFGVGIAVWTLRLPETLPPPERVPLRFGRLMGAARIVVSNPITMRYTLAQTAVFGFFQSYLASSQLIIEDIFDLDAWFPLIFGLTAVLMGAALLSNTRLVHIYELRPLLRTIFGAYLVAGLVFAVVIVASGGHPGFAVFIATLLPILVAQSLLIPNLNAIAMIPMGAVAGSAAAIIGMTSTLGGAIIGASIDALYDGSLIPFGIAAAATGIASYLFMLWADKAYRAQEGVQVSAG